MEALGPYKILRELGRGGCGTVYLALDPRIGRKVAIKTVSPVSDSSLSEALRARFRREAQAAGGLTHPNIVTIYEYDDNASLAYLVMEYVEGCTLSEKMEAGSLSLDFTLSLLDAASGALDFAHAQNVVHRDVKPANFLISHNGLVKVADFGIAKIMDADTGGLTSTGMLVGTVQYMSPEQVAAKPVSGQSDQFSLAVIGYEMLTGRRPFTGDSWASVLHQIMSVDPAPVRQFRGDPDDSMTAVLRKALSKDPQNRYPTCESFVRELREASGIASMPRTLLLPKESRAAAGIPAADVPTQTIAYPLPEFPPKPRPSSEPEQNARKKVWWIGAAALVLLAAGGMGYRFWVSRPAPGPAVVATAPSAAGMPAPVQPTVQPTASQPVSNAPASTKPAGLVPPAPPAAVQKSGESTRNTGVAQPVGTGSHALPAPETPAPAINAATQNPPPPPPLPASPPAPAPALAPATAPPLPENRAVQPDPRAVEAAAWDRVRASTDIAALERFQASFPNGPFRAEAARRVEQVEYEQASRADTAKAYRDFLAKYPAGTYSDRATAELTKIDRAGQTAANRRLVDAALQIYRQAFEHKDAALLKTVWPSLSPADLNSFQNFFRIARTVKLDLQLTGEPEIGLDGAVVKCRRVLTATDERGPLPSQDQMVTIRLRKVGDAMLIESAQAAAR